MAPAGLRPRRPCFNRGDVARLALICPDIPNAAGLIAHCTELLSVLGPVRVSRMFGGNGVYVDGLFLALIARDSLFLKTDETSRQAFEAAGCQPFAFETAKGARAVLGYWSAPDEAMESPAAMLPWARLAMASALRAAAKRPAASRKAAAKPRSKAPAKG